MRVHLLARDRDVSAEIPWDADPGPQDAAVTQDLGLSALFAAMAAGDEYFADVARRVVLTPLVDPDAIGYRQAVLTDCLGRPSVVRQLHDIALDALRSTRKVGIEFLLRTSPDAVLRRAVRIMELLLGDLRRLRTVATEHTAGFRSEGFARFFATVRDELDAEYLMSIEEHLATLKLPDGVLMSAELGTGDKGVRYTLHRAPHARWWERLAGTGEGYWFEIHPRDEAGSRALGELEGRGVDLAAAALAQSVDHVLGFFRMLRAELAFYLGCLNLHADLKARGAPTCLPVPHPLGAPAVFTTRGLYDAGLALALGSRPVGNDVDADGKHLVVVTGANEGGKSTFLRSVGLAQLMMQSGLFVAADAFAATVRTGVFTHFTREEDATMTHGKLEEELSRMSEVVDHLRPGALLLCNESFASTNEREGSEIGRQVVRAATESGVTVVFVTHLYDLARDLQSRDDGADLFLRAEREADGRRTYRMAPGAPRPTSHGEDSYRRVFGAR